MPSKSTNDPEKFKGQTRIEGDQVVGGDPAGKNCEWCSEAATVSFEMQRRIKNARAGATTGTGQFIFACREHEEIARKIANEPRPARR